MCDDLRIAHGHLQSATSLASISFEHAQTGASVGATPVQYSGIFYANKSGTEKCNKSRCAAPSKATQEFVNVVSLKGDIEKGISYVKTDRDTNKTKESPQSGFFSSLVTLAMTSLGFGLLSLPSAFASSGVTMGVVLVVAFGILTDVGLCIIIKVARATRQESLESVAEYFYGRTFGRFVRFNLIFCLFLGIVSAFAIFMETWGRSGDSAVNSGLIRKYARCGPTQCSGITKATVGLMGLILIFPILFQESLHGLRHVSALAGLCLFASLGIFGYIYQDLVVTGLYEPIHETVDFFGDAWGLCSVLGIAFMSYLCHFNIIPVYLEMQNKDQIYSVIHASIFGVVIPVNLLIGLCGYFLFGKNVEGNVFNSMHGKLGHLAAFIVALMSLLKLPLIFRPFKVAMFAELGLHDDHKMTRRVLTAVFVLLAFLVAIFVNLEDVSAIGGALSGSAISFLFPGLYMFANSRNVRQTSILQDHDGSLENSVTTRAESELECPDVPAEAGVLAVELANVKRSSSKLAPVTLLVEWRQLSRRGKGGVALGLAFCTLAFLCGSIGVASAIISFLATHQ